MQNYDLRELARLLNIPLRVLLKLEKKTLKEIIKDKIFYYELKLDDVDRKLSHLKNINENLFS